MKTHWFTSPSQHWLSGLLIEIATFSGFLLTAWILALLLMWAL